VDVWFHKEKEDRFDTNTEDIPFLHKHKRDSFLWLAGPALIRAVADYFIRRNEDGNA
jgi:hypothetical protein